MQCPAWCPHVVTCLPPLPSPSLPFAYPAQWYLELVPHGMGTSPYPLCPLAVVGSMTGEVSQFISSRLTRNLLLSGCCGLPGLGPGLSWLGAVSRRAAHQILQA